MSTANSSLPTYASTGSTGGEDDGDVRVQARREDVYLSNTVFVNTYDMTEANAFLATLGIGAHHVGIQVYDTEYHFGLHANGTGIGISEPCYCAPPPPHLFREQYAVGQTPLDATQARSLVDAMQKDPL